MLITLISLKINVFPFFYGEALCILYINMLIDNTLKRHLLIRAFTLHPKLREITCTRASGVRKKARDGACLEKIANIILQYKGS